MIGAGLQSASEQTIRPLASSNVIRYRLCVENQHANRRRGRAESKTMETLSI